MSFGRLNRRWLVVTVVAAVATMGLLAVQTPAQPVPESGADLGAEMTAMSKDLRTVTSGVADASKNTATLAALSDLEKHILNAKELTPPGASTQPDDQKAAYVAGFRLELVTLTRAVLDVEEAILNNDNAKAAVAAKVIGTIEGAGHKAYRPARGN